MKCPLSALHSLAALIGAAVLFALASGAVSADPAISVSPVSGSLFDQFTVSGSGLQPGASLKVTFADSTGASYSLVDAYGNAESVLVRGDGGFDLQVQPKNDLKISTPGTWKVRVCTADSSTCWSSDLQVTAVTTVPGYGGDGGMGGGGDGGGGGGMGGY